ncbi:MAG: AarF/UbiB family protein, partial [Planctomycetota bacterium]|nr:AarF/UbiB family protein [Planctomycetota bacterium]
MKITTIPQVYRNVNRWGEILTVLSKYGLADWLSRFDLDFAKGWLKDRGGEVLARQTRETRIRLALSELGPTFIKLGQILSTRPDVVGVVLADELEKLQADVAADPPDVVRRIIEQELGQPVNELFVEFDDQPLASASIGQVHRARLSSGAAVVVKVQHAGIEDKVSVDLDILTGLAQMAERIPEFVNYRPRATAAEFQRVLRRELDFGREERNMQQFHRDFADNPSIKIPQVYVDLSTPRVLTMERVEGIKLTDCRQIS